MKKISLILVFLVGFEVMAWGPIGHRVVGEVAEKHITKKALKSLKRVLGPESLASVSNWMDHVKSDNNYDHMYDWHWVTIPDGQRYGETEKNPDGDIVMTLKRVISELKSGTLEGDKEIENLKILIHLIGDLHQPLHVGTGEDQGGNQVKVKWFGRNSNLHRVYDSDAINSMQLSFTELSRFVDRHTDEQVMQWQSGDVEDWAHEAMTYRDRVYDLPEDMSLGYDFMYGNTKFIEEQLLKGGLRLAYILNDIYG